MPQSDPFQVLPFRSRGQAVSSVLLWVRDSQLDDAEIDATFTTSVCFARFTKTKKVPGIAHPLIFAVPVLTEASQSPNMLFTSSSHTIARIDNK